MKEYKIKNKIFPFNFTSEEVSTILKYKFNPVVLNDDEQKIRLGKILYGTKRIAFKITDELLLDSLRTQQDKEKTEEYIRECLEDGELIEPDGFILEFEFDDNDFMVYASIRVLGTPFTPTYLHEEVAILAGNDYEKCHDYEKNMNLYPQEVKEKINKLNKKYTGLLKKHGYID